MHNIENTKNQVIMNSVKSKRAEKRSKKILLISPDTGVTSAYTQ